MNALVENISAGDIPGVTEVVSKVRNSLEKNFSFVWVRGEIADFSASSAGHLYFSLKDERSLLRCVWFRGAKNATSNNFNPLTGEIYEKPVPNMFNLLKNGLELVCGGKISFYSAGGSCQLIVEFAELAGVGLLAQAFEALRQSLAARGFFDQAHKKPLPLHPGRIALVTSLQGAALHDFLKIARLRGLKSIIRIFPVPVQGGEASKRIAVTLAMIGRQNWADVVVLCRGGGSQEDLWPFNEEILVQAIYEAQIPVLTGIGHEIDLSLADLAADARAATPTHAAQLIFASRMDLMQRVDHAELRLKGAMQRILEKQFFLCNSLEALLQAKSPQPALAHRQENIGYLEERLFNCISSIMQKNQQELEKKAIQLNALSPVRNLLLLDNRLSELLRLMNKLFYALCENKGNRLAFSLERLKNATINVLNNKNILISGLESSLKVLDPDNALKRGYAMVYKEGRIVPTIKSVMRGDLLQIKMADGEMEVQVLSDSINRN